MKLKIRNVEFKYASVPALKNVCLELNESEILAIVGPNGAGKSTLLKCIARILEPQKGSILLNGEDIRKMNLIDLARRIGYVPQSTHQFFPATVFEVVLMGRRPYISWLSSKRDEEVVLDVLQMLNIEDLAMRDINELSGGQQQKVLIARALAQEPEVLLLDEPTANLDIRHQIEVMKMIRSIVKEKGITAIIAIHDLNLASRYADRIVMMKDGRIFAVGSPNKVLTPTNIEEVYGVRVEVIKLGRIICVVPLDSLNGVSESLQRGL